MAGRGRNADVSADSSSEDELYERLERLHAPRNAPGPRGRGRGRGNRGRRPEPERRPQRAAPVLPPPGPATVKTNFDAFAVSVPRTCQAAGAILEAEGFRVRYVAGTSEHPLQHATREYATACAVFDAYNRGYHDIVSVYGADRDITIVEYLNKNVAEAQQIRLTVTGEAVTAGDVTRRRRGALAAWTAAQPRGPVAILLVDIYHAVHVGAEPAEPLTPASCAQVLQQAREAYGREAVIYWVGHPMLNVIGAFDEACYVRQEDGTVLYRSDKFAATYPAHSPCDWWYADGVSAAAPNCAWAVMQSVRGTAINVFAAADVLAGAQAGLVFGVDWEVAAVPDLRPGSWITKSTLDALRAYVPDIMFQAVLTFLPRRNVLVDKRIVAKAADWLFGKSYNPYSQRQLIAYVRDALTKEVWFARVRELFPDKANLLVEDNCLVALIRNLETRAADAAAIDFAASPTMADYNKRAASLGSPQTPTTSGLGSWVLAAVALLALYRYRRQAIGWVKASRSVQASGTLAALVSGGVAGIRQAFSRVSGFSLSAQLGASTPADYAWIVFGLSAPFLEEWARSVAIKTQPTFFSTVGRFVVDDFTSDIIWWALAKALNWNMLRAPWLADGLSPNERWARASMACAVRVVLHSLFTAVNAHFGMWPASILHFAWNYRATRTLLTVAHSAADASVPASGLWNTFKRMFHQARDGSPWPQVPPAQDPTEAWETLPCDGAINRVDKAHESPSATADPVGKWTGSLHVAEQRPHDHVHWALATNAPGYAPARTDANLEAVVKQRLLVAPPMAPEKQAGAWLALRHRVPPHVRLGPLWRDGPADVIDWEEACPRWLDHLDDAMRRNRALAALEQLRGAAPEPTDRVFNTTEVMVKTNELLFRRDGDQPSLKPRPIAAVNPQAQVVIAPLVYEAQQRLKACWPMMPSEPTLTVETPTGPFAIYIGFASSATDWELTRWASAPHELLHPGHPDALFLIVAGDDSLGAFSLRDRVARVLKYLENDFSKYDGSLSSAPVPPEAIIPGEPVVYGPLEDEYAALEWLGAGQAVPFLQHLSGADYIAKGKTSSIKITRRSARTRDTGGPDTTFGNSWDNASAWVDAVARYGRAVVDAHVFSRAMAELGLAAKARLHNSITATSFLKGTWYPVLNANSAAVWGQEWCWAPLPSRILKAGKCLRPFTEVFDLSDLPKTERYAVGAVQFLALQAESLSHYARVPILGAFVDKYRPLWQNRKLRQYRPETWKVQAVAASADGPALQPDEEAAYECVAARYGVGVIDLLRCERLIRESTNTAFLSHPLFEAMARVDYG